MDVDRAKGGNSADSEAGEYVQRVEAASQEYRIRLQEKAANMRAAVLEGETSDERVLEVAEELERLAGNET